MEKKKYCVLERKRKAFLHCILFDKVYCPRGVFFLGFWVVSKKSFKNVCVCALYRMYVCDRVGGFRNK